MTDVLQRRTTVIQSPHTQLAQARHAAATEELMRTRGSVVMGRNMYGPIEMEGGTTFHFVTDGFESAYAQAKAVAGADGEVLVSGGASTVRQALQSGAASKFLIGT